jgi:hypothetical protein
VDLQAKSTSVPGTTEIECGEAIEQIGYKARETGKP